MIRFTIPLSFSDLFFGGAAPQSCRDFIIVGFGVVVLMEDEGSVVVVNSGVVCNTEVAMVVAIDVGWSDVEKSGEVCTTEVVVIVAIDVVLSVPDGYEVKPLSFTISSNRYASIPVVITQTKIIASSILISQKNLHKLHF